MENRKILSMKHIASPLLIILFAVILRLIPHPPNFVPIAAMALFGGAYLDKRYALIIPIIAMLISDYFLGFHNTMLFVYVSFLLSGFIGLWLRKHKKINNIIAATFCSSLLFFIITNFGVWFVGNLYPKTFAGFIECYIAAIPFFRNTILGDLFYTGFFFGSYELILRYLRSEVVAKKSI